MSVRVSKENFSDKVLGASGLAAADFYSDGCVPCKRLSPVLAEIEEENSDVQIFKVNINFDAELAEEYKVTSVPTVLFFKDGKEVSRLSGAISKNKLTEEINSVK